MEGVSFAKGEEEVRTPSSGDDGAEVAKALCGEPPGVFVVLRVSAESLNVDLRVGDANGDSAKLLLPVGVPNTEALAGLSDAFSAVPKVVGDLEAKEAKPPADAETSGVFSGVVDVAGVAPNGEGFAAANALNPPPDDFTLAANAKVLVSGEPKTAGAGGLPKLGGVLAKAANPLAEVAGVMPKLGFPKVGCPNEEFPKVGDANPD